jgi:hypothetical protein
MTGALTRTFCGISLYLDKTRISTHKQRNKQIDTPQANIHSNQRKDSVKSRKHDLVDVVTSVQTQSFAQHFIRITHLLLPETKKKKKKKKISAKRWHDKKAGHNLAFGAP